MTAIHQCGSDKSTHAFKAAQKKSPTGTTSYRPLERNTQSGLIAVRSV